MGHLAGEFLTSKADEVGTRNHRDIGQDEDNQMVVGRVLEDISADNGSGDEGPEHIDGAGDPAGTSERNSEEAEKEH